MFRDTSWGLSAREWLQFGLVASFVMVVDGAIGRPIFLVSLLAAFVPIIGIRWMYQSGLRSAGVDPGESSPLLSERVTFAIILIVFLVNVVVPVATGHIALRM